MEPFSRSGASIDPAGRKNISARVYQAMFNSDTLWQ